MSAQSDWAQLFRIAYAMIRQVNAEQNIIDRWMFGGGTADDAASLASSAFVDVAKASQPK
ncbi:MULTISPECIES: hypothetical protein [unclassified Bradyrhizobium]|uniref:hypothetical protein n=1 Tax=unclassified Bradyrhizobium TaxID=2631580 RepID=UPI00211E5708|nr:MULTISPECIES: hypothetical protein [unclassified Bradyrhizobium]MDD1584974.1 hypothetical protein [Bradyrhizobium sp. WBOS4]